MDASKVSGITFCSAVFAVTVALASTMTAESTKVEGLIVGRSGDEMIVQIAKGAELAFLITDNTKVSQVAGALKARRKEMALATLIPGLKVKAEGTYNESRVLIATSVKFKGNDLEHAQAIEAGMHETKMQAAENKAELERQAEALRIQNEALQKQQAQLAEHQAKIAENRAAIEAATARFGQLDDYYIFDELTVYFANGKITVDPNDAQLMALADKANTIEGYVIEVKGYASTSGSVSLNQRLSQDRAANVTNILLQKGHVSLTRILAPGAMGEAHQVGNDKTAEGQAENRRVVVRVLQNKAIAGI